MVPWETSKEKTIVRLDMEGPLVFYYLFPKLPTVKDRFQQAVSIIYPGFYHKNSYNH